MVKGLMSLNNSIIDDLHEFLIVAFFIFKVFHELEVFQGEILIEGKVVDVGLQ